jgi:FAD/FMN-containing dehydrogenase
VNTNFLAKKQQVLSHLALHIKEAILYSKSFITIKKHEGPQMKNFYKAHNMIFIFTICALSSSISLPMEQKKEVLPSGELWRNRAGNQQCKPHSRWYPETREELINCVTTSASKGLKIRAVGAGYSRSSLVCTDGSLVDLRHLNHILSVDRAAMRVCVQAGCSIAQLNEDLASYGLALSNQAATADINLAGALSTASHGSGHTGSLSSFVVGIELIDALGKVHTLSPDSDPNIFASARMSLGALGILYSVTLQCEPLFYLRKNQTTMKVKDFIADYQNLHNAHDYLQAIWAIENDEVKIDTWSYVEAATMNKDNTDSNVAVCYKSLCWFSTDNGNGSDIAAEYAVPIDALPIAFAHIKELIQKYQKKGLKEMSTLVVRFASKDADILLSPAGHGPVAYINVSTPVKDLYMPYYRELEDKMLALAGRPHWGKINFLNYQKLFMLYGDNLTKFISAKTELDPLGFFSNAHIDELFTK